MADVREQILARLAAILDTVPATLLGQPGVFTTRARNRSELTETQRPALVLLDGDETVDPAFVKGSRSAAPRLVTMAPEIAVVLGGREPKNEQIGQDINAIRIAILKAVSNDAALQAILGPNGSLQYGGLVTDLGWHRSLEGILVMSFQITYALQIARL